MKRIILSLLLCFVYVNVYAVTAEEVFKKSTEIEFFNYSDHPSYEIIYEFRSSIREGMATVYKETTDGTKKRIDAATIGPDMKGEIHVSMILTDEASYVSSKYVSSEGVINFSEYMVVNDTASVRTYDKNTSRENNLNAMQAVFSADYKKDSKDYLIDVAVKDPKKVREEYKKKKENNEEVTMDELVLNLVSNFEMKYAIDKKNYFVNMTEIKMSEEAVYESVSKSDEYKDKSEEEKRQAAKDIVTEAGAFATVMFSDYKKVEGTRFFYPEKMYTVYNFLTDESGVQNYMEMKTVSLKILKSGEIDPALFIPPVIKKGKGKVPKEFSQGDVYGIMADKLKNDLKKAIKESIKESVKEAAKEEGKNMLKKGVKGAFKGLTGF